MDGGGLMVSVLAFYSGNPRSNSSEVYTVLSEKC